MVQPLRFLTPGVLQRQTRPETIASRAPSSDREPVKRRPFGRDSDAQRQVMTALMAKALLTIDSELPLAMNFLGNDDATIGPG
jgi:hypothetical protein